MDIQGLHTYIDQVKGGLRDTKLVESVRRWFLKPGTAFLYCPRCKKPPESPLRPISLSIAEKQYEFYWCCEDFRAFGIFALACGWDQPKPTRTSSRIAAMQVGHPTQTHAGGAGGPALPSPKSALPSIAELKLPPVARSKGTGYEGPEASLYAFAQDSPFSSPNTSVASGSNSLPSLNPLAPTFAPFTPNQSTTSGSQAYTPSPSPSPSPSPFTSAVSFFPSLLPRWRRKVPPPIKPPVKDVKEMVIQEGYFKLIARLLPSYDRSNGLSISDLDTSPSASIHTMLALSPLLHHAALMLTNDSPEDIASQQSLYDGVLDFVNALGAHALIAPLVYRNRPIFPTDVNLLSVSQKRHTSQVSARDTGKSFAELLARLATQCQTILHHAKKHEGEFSGRTGSNMMAWCHRVVQISTDHKANSRQFDVAKSETTNQETEVDFAKYHRENGVKDIADQRILADFAYFSEANKCASAAQPKGRVKRLVTEISTLQTSLPEGVFLRHGDSRLDIMKVLIVGPKDTPYEYGLFEFDMFCPLEYPNVAPKLRFRTTDGGRVQFNPNLYADGKVCLSLLGTWSGEPWRAGQSTLLQLLVSLQSMVFCADPWYNEPGSELHPDEEASDKYNERIRAQTLKYAILPWINAIPANAMVTPGIWGEVAQCHFRGCVKDIGSRIRPAAQKPGQVQHAWSELQEAFLKQGYKA